MNALNPSLPLALCFSFFFSFSFSQFPGVGIQCSALCERSSMHFKPGCRVASFRIIENTSTVNIKVSTSLFLRLLDIALQGSFLG